MKTNVILGTLCVVVTAFALTIGYSQLPGTVVDATELASVYGGACIRDVTLSIKSKRTAFPRVRMHDVDQQLRFG